jgi:hypothetical protein
LREKFGLDRFHGLAIVSFVCTFPQATLDRVHFHALPKSPVFTLSETGSARKISFLRADFGSRVSVETAAPCVYNTANGSCVENACG